MSKFDKDPLPGQSQKKSILNEFDEFFLSKACSIVRVYIAIGSLLFNWVKTCGAQQIKIQSKTV